MLRVVLIQKRLTCQCGIMLGQDSNLLRLETTTSIYIYTYIYITSKCRSCIFITIKQRHHFGNVGGAAASTPTSPKSEIPPPHNICRFWKIEVLIKRIVHYVKYAKCVLFVFFLYYINNLPVTSVPLPSRQVREMCLRNPLSPQSSSTTLCWTDPSPTTTGHSLMTTSLCWPLLSAS